MNLVGDFIQAVYEAVDETTEAGKVAAIIRSSGPFSQEMLDAMDNPYAKRHDDPLLPPEVINVQTGEFRSAWRKTSTVIHQDSIEGSVMNDDKAGYYLTLNGGTKFMVERPIDTDVEAFMEKDLEARLTKKLTTWSKTKYKI